MKFCACVALVIAALLGSSLGHAMGMRSYDEVRAWSPDGQTVLIDQSVNGPEGGGSLAMLVVDAAHKKAERFELSADFSPGDGSTPESIKTADCEARAKQLQLRLKDFKGIVVAPERCAGDRHAVVQVWTDKVTAGLPLPCEGLALQPTGKGLALARQGKATVALPGAGWPAKPRATLGPARKVLVVLGDEFLAVLVSLSGDWAKPERLQLPAR